MRRKIMTAVILLTFLPTLLIGLVMNYYTQTTIEKTKLESLTNMVNMMDFHLERYHERLTSNIQKKAEEELFRQLLNEEENSVVLNHDDFRELRKIILEDVSFPVAGGAILDPNGRILISNQLSEEGLMLDKTALYRRIMAGEESYIGLLKNSDSSEKVEIAVPILGKYGNTIGIFKQIVKLDSLMEYLDLVSVGKTDYAFLIRKNGSLIKQDDKQHLTMLYNEYENKNTLEQLVSDFKNDRLKEPTGMVEFEVKGNEYTGMYKVVDEINCIAVIAINHNEMFGDLIVAKEMLLILIMMIIITSGLIGYLLGDSMIKPLKVINSNIRKIIDGDLTVRCTYDGNDEYKELSENVNNIAESLQKTERELRLSARIDNLTRLPNRSAIYEVLDTLLYKHPNQALLFLDLDGFQLINNNLGHDIGDRILMEVGDILRSLPQHVCYTSRLGGDEFMIFITNWTSAKYPERIAEKIIKEIEGIRFIDEIHVDISVSIGIEYMNGEKIDKKKRIKHGDFAMRKAKNTGKNSYVVYDSSMRKEY